MMKTIRRALIGICLAGLGSLPAFGASAPHVNVELVSENESVRPGQPFWVGVHFKLEKHWHIYWQNPGDSGAPPRIAWQLPTGFEAGPISWPTPSRLPVGPLMNYGYEDSVLLMVPIKTVQIPIGKDIELDAQIKWLVCNDVCIPGKANVKLALPVLAGDPIKSTEARMFLEARAALPAPWPVGRAISALGGRDGFVLEVMAPGNEGEIRFFPAVSNQIENAAPQELTRVGDRAKLQLKRSDQLTQLPDRLKGILVLSGKAYLVEPPVKPGQGMPPSGSPPLLIEVLILAFLGGLVLNLMPCVFPVLSIKALALIRQTHAHQREAKVHSVFYALGVLVSFWALAAVILIFRAGGEKLGWGFQLQSPTFVGGLACVLFLLAMNLLGAFEIGGSLMGVGGSWASRKGHLGAFFTGVLATVVATPCTAPFMGTALGFAVSQPTVEALGVFTALALGLAFPYCMIAFLPVLARVIPKPGRWMETLKQAMAFPLFGTVIWLLWVLSLESGAGAVAKTLIGIWLLSLAIWLHKRWAKPAARVFALLLGIGGFFASLGAGGRAASPATLSGDSVWQPYSHAKVQEYVGGGHPVFVDFTAAWCVTCKVNETIALTPFVLGRMKEQGVAILRADWTNSDPEITVALDEFGRNGVPLYVLYPGKPGATPTVLPQLLTSQLVLDELEKLKTTGN